MKKISVEQIEDNMILAREVYGSNGNILLRKGSTLNAGHARRLGELGIDSLYIECNESDEDGEKTAVKGPEEIRRELEQRFRQTLDNTLMNEIFNAVLQYRIKKAVS